MKKLLLLMRGIVAFILLQSLFYKFTAHPQATYIFTTLGIEPYGRIGIGIAELIVSVLLFFSKNKNYIDFINHRNYDRSYFFSPIHRFRHSC